MLSQFAGKMQPANSGSECGCWYRKRGSCQWDKRVLVLFSSAGYLALSTSKNCTNKMPLLCADSICSGSVCWYHQIQYLSPVSVTFQGQTRPW